MSEAFRVSTSLPILGNIHLSDYRHSGAGELLPYRGSLIFISISTDDIVHLVMVSYIVLKS